MRKTMVSFLGVVALVAALVGPLGSRNVAAATGREPVIIIPGVAGSEFTAGWSFRLNVPNGRGGTYTRDYSAGEKIWVNTWQAAALGEDDYFDALKMQPDGVTPVAPALYVNDIYHSAYDDLINYLRGQGYVSGVDLWIFPFDWRRDLRTTASQLDAVVTRALVASNGGRTDPATWTIRRADIVAHSMGGLVSRYYVSDAARANRIDQMITLGSPQLGASKFLKTLMYGDQFGPSFLGIGLNPDEIKDVVQNMPGAMQLLPTRAYYTYYDNSDTNHLRPFIESRDFDGNGTAGGALGYTSVKQLLLNTGRNGTVLNIAEATHDALDGQMNGGVHGVRWAALVGYNQSTFGQVREYTGSCLTWSWYQPCPKRDELTFDGDGTVPTLSAAMGDPWRSNLINSGAQRWYVEREHGAMVSRDYVLGIATGDGNVLPWIGDLLRGTLAMAPSSDTAAVGGVSAQPTAQLGGLWIGALGPVALTVRDAAGGTAGRERAGAEPLQSTIPGASYDRLPGSEFSYLKNDASYTLDLAAEQAGSVDLKIRIMNRGGIAQTAIYQGIALEANSRAQVVLPAGLANASADAWPVVQIDREGDGVFDSKATLTALLDASASADITAPSLQVDGLNTSRGVQGPVVARWQASDNESGLLHTSAVLNPGTATARSVANGESLRLAPGSYRLVVVATDRAGNAQSSEQVFSVR